MDERGHHDLDLAIPGVEGERSAGKTETRGEQGDCLLRSHSFSCESAAAFVCSGSPLAPVPRKMLLLETRDPGLGMRRRRVCARQQR